LSKRLAKVFTSQDDITRAGCFGKAELRNMNFSRRFNPFDTFEFLTTVFGLSGLLSGKIASNKVF
jgi:hypothetical protein